MKKTLKDWENDFCQRHGKRPEKADIKKYPAIQQKYKEYRHLKAGKIAVKTVKTVEINTGLSTPQKSSPIQEIVTTDVDHVEDSPTKVLTQIGPTPQLNGRIMGIFDLNKTPDKNQAVTPSKDVNCSPSKVMVITPSIRRKIDFNDCCLESEDEPATQLLAPLEQATKLFKKVSTPTHTRVYNSSPGSRKSPQKSPWKRSPYHRSNIMTTPSYFHQGVSVVLKTPSRGPSEASEKSKAVRKTLSEIFNECQKIQEDFKLEQDGIQMEIEMDLKEQQLLLDIEKADEAEGLDSRYDLMGEMGRSRNEFEGSLQADKPIEPPKENWFKKKQPKRQTRRHKMKGRGTTEEEAITDDEEINRQIVKLKEDLVEKAVAVEDGKEQEEYISSSEEEGEYESKARAPVTGKRLAGGVSKNFVRYKLKKRGNKNFRRR